ARHAGAQQAGADADLARRRPRQELAERDEIDIGALVEPAAALDELGVKIAEMRDRPAERGQAELEKDREHLRPAARGLAPLPLALIVRHGKSDRLVTRAGHPYNVTGQMS